jgi:hypothetical protein
VNHIPEEELERYHLGMVRYEAELAVLEEHYLACSKCAQRIEELGCYIDAVRSAIVLGDFDGDV